MSSADYGLLAPVWADRPVATVTGDGALVDAMIEAVVALARARGVRATPPVLDAADLAARTRATGDPVTALLAALEDSDLHRGASGQDILDTALMLTARRALALTALDLDTAIAVAAGLAAEYRDTPMAARALTRPAVPATFGLKAAGWHHLLTTARRAVSSTAQARLVQLGGAGGTLASFVAMAEADAPYVPRGAAVDVQKPVSSSGNSQDDAATGAENDTAGGTATSSDTGRAVTITELYADVELLTDSAPPETGSALSKTGNASPEPCEPRAAQAGAGSVQSPAEARDQGAAQGGTGNIGSPTEPHRPDATATENDGVAPQPEPCDPWAPQPETGGVASPTESALALVSRFARILGLAEPPLPWHTLRTPIAELASTLALTSGALGKIAADILFLGRPEIGEVTHDTGSSSPPDPARPVRAVLVAGAARQVPVLVSVLFASVAAEDERAVGAWHAEWQPLREALRLVGGSAATMAEVLAALRVRPERMADNLTGLDLAEAREFTGRAVSDPRDYLGAAAALVDRVLKPGE